MRTPHPPPAAETPAEPAAAAEGPNTRTSTEPDRGPRVAAATGAALLVALLHGANDAYAAFLPALLPDLMSRHALSITQAATLTMVLSLAAALPQPGLGWFADRFGRRLFVVGGPVLSAVFLSSIGLAGSFAGLIGLLIVGGIGSAAFHPPGASAAARTDQGQGSGLRLSVFTFGGSAGYALGPLIAIGLAARFGLEAVWIAAVPTVLLGFLAWPALSDRRRADRPAPSPPPSPSELARMLWGPLGLLFGISAVAAFVQRVFLTLEPIIVQEAGGGEGVRAAALTVFLGAQAIGSVAGGVLSDRVDRPRLIALSIALCAPAYFAAVTLPPGQASWTVAVALAGALNMAVMPPVILMAQEIVPRGASSSSGIVMGLAWAAGSVGLIGTGVLGDLFGAVVSAQLAGPVLLLGAFFALHPSLRRAERLQRPLPTGPAAAGPPD